MLKKRRIKVKGNHNITGYNVSDSGNVTNITMGASDPLEKLESKVAFSALLNSEERYPAPYCHPGTRIAARKVVKGWTARQGFGSEKNIMWISGGPGVGKSALLQTVCVCDSASPGDDVSIFVDIEDDNSLIDACFFFGRGMGEREQACFFPITVAYQLVQSRVSWADAIRGILAEKPSILREAFPFQFRTLVLMPAKAHAPSEAPVTVVIDALDECNSVRDQLTLLDAIFEAATTANMRFVIASRPELDIQAFFQREDVSRHTYHIQLDNDFQARRDIEIFLWAKFADIRERRPALCPRLPNGEDWPGSITIYRLRDKSGGLFIYATLVIAFIDTPYYSPDQQLKALLAAPPARAFSMLDTLYRQILTRAPPELPAGCNELLEFQKLVKGILQVVVCWRNPLTGAEIAGILDKEVDVVQAIILGPICSLFTFDSSKSTITLCHKSLRDYLLDRVRSQDFFVPTHSPDGLCIDFLSRQPRPGPLQSYSRKHLIDVMVVVHELNGEVDVPRIASFLDVAPNSVEYIVFGPAKAIFAESSDGNVCRSAFGSHLWYLLLDAGRAGGFFVSSRMRDAPFIQFLSRQPPPDSSRSYFRKHLIDVLVVVEALGPRKVDVPRIASFLDVAPNAVETIVSGPAKALFAEESNGNVRCSGLGYSLLYILGSASRGGKFFVSKHMRDTLFIQFLSRQPPPDPLRSYSRKHLFNLLLDAGHAGEFFIRTCMRHTPFIQFLSRQPPPDPSQSYSRKHLIDVLVVVEALHPGKVDVPGIASFLGVAPNAVEAIVSGPAKALFAEDSDGNVCCLGLADYLWYFLQDAGRAGKFFLRSEHAQDTLFIQFLSRQPPPDPSQLYSRKDLVDVLVVVSAAVNDGVVVVETLNPGKVDVPRIASFLDIAPNAVEAIVSGPAKALFGVESDGNVCCSLLGYYLSDFLLDAGRAGEFFVSRHMQDNPFIQFLSRQPPPDPSQSYSRKDLVDFLVAVEALEGEVDVPRIASFLGIAANAVETIVSGPAKALFAENSDGNVHCSWLGYYLWNFLLDSSRAGEFFVSRHMRDTPFIQFLSRQPPPDPSQSDSRKDLFNFLLDASHAGEFFIPTRYIRYAPFFDQPPPDPLQSYSRNDLINLLVVVEGLDGKVDPFQIEPFLDVARNTVEAIISGPAKALFAESPNGGIRRSGLAHYLWAFLLDASRAGEFVIPKHVQDYLPILRRRNRRPSLQTVSISAPLYGPFVGGLHSYL